jgi:hypothetical protein
MRFQKIAGAFFALMILAASCTPIAKKDDGSVTATPGNASGIWKKQVTRDIDMTEREDTMTHRLKGQNGDTSLFEMLVSAIRSGKLTAYNNIGPFFTNKLSDAELKDMMATKTDTVVVSDPVTGNNTTSIVSKDFQYRDIHKYRVLELWEFDPATGKTEIQITGVAPLMDLYTQNISGLQHAIFWLRYEDAKSILAAYEQLHPDNTLSSHIWSDYFQSDERPVMQK